MTKAELRQEFLAKRKALTVDEVQRRSQLITRQFIDVLEKDQRPGKTSLIHTFLPIQRQNEVDTWPLVRAIWADFPTIQLVASVTDLSKNQLTHYPLSPLTTLQINRWGIPEPIPDGQLPVDVTRIDFVLVPLLAFDEQGHRVGYGGGYYDRFLAECRSDCRKVGLSLFESIDRIDNPDVTDIPLNSCITPTQLTVFI